MDLVYVLLMNAGVLLAGFILVWLLSIPLRDASIVDVFWGPAAVLVAWATWLFADGDTLRAALVHAAVTLWGVRLALHIGVRNIGHEEDRRYQAMREKSSLPFWFASLYIVFLLQAAVMWVLSLPVQVAIHAPAPEALTWLDYTGAALFLFGFLFEAIGDWQLSRFKADPDNKGKVMDEGLWRYTRHPNYFGEAVLWWGIGLMALSVPGAWWTLIGPLVITLLLLKVSGVAMLEKDISERRPEYEAYKKRTSAFLPLPPRKQ